MCYSAIPVGREVSVHQNFNGMNVMMQQSVVGGYQQSLIKMAERFLPVSGNATSQAITNIGRHDKLLFTGIFTQVIKYFINPYRSLPAFDPDHIQHPAVYLLFMANGFECLRTDNNIGVILWRQPFKTKGDIHAVANHSGVHPRRGRAPTP